MKQILIFSVFLTSILATSQNLIDSSSWISGTNGATANYSMQGTTSQNSRITMNGPYGSPVTVWRGSADGSSGMNGGFSHSGFTVNTNKTYKISFWMRSSGSNSCTNYSGFVPYYSSGGLVQPFDREDGTGVSWPYFSSVNLPDDKWYLVVGYIRPSSVSDIGDSGVYDSTLGTSSNIPAPAFGVSDFIFPSGVSQISIRIRTFMWACASGDMFVYDPRIEELSNTTPLEALLYGNSTDNQPPTAPTLVSTSKTETTVNLSWSDSNDNIGVTGYKVYQDNALKTTLGNTTTYQVTGLVAETAYQFTVKAIDAGGNESPNSNIISLTTNLDSSSSGNGDSSSTVWSESNTTASYNGSVAIGINSVPNGYKLAVEGKIRAREIKVDTESWPDYVFKEDYKLLSLEEIQKHISEKGYLPNIPSAKEVETNGLELGEMNKLLLEKIEELTLYIIFLNKENQEQQKSIELLKNNQ